MSRHVRCPRCGACDRYSWSGTPRTTPDVLLVRCTCGRCRGTFLQRLPRGTDHGELLPPDRRRDQLELRPW